MVTRGLLEYVDVVEGEHLDFLLDVIMNQENVVVEVIGPRPVVPQERLGGETQDILVQRRGLDSVSQKRALQIPVLVPDEEVVVDQSPDSEEGASFLVIIVLFLVYRRTSYRNVQLAVVVLVAGNVLPQNDVAVGPVQGKRYFLSPTFGRGDDSVIKGHLIGELEEHSLGNE